MRAPTVGYPSRDTSNTSGAYIFFYRFGRLVIVNGSINVTNVTTNKRLLYGLPKPMLGTGVASVVRVIAHRERASAWTGLVNANGELMTELFNDTGWYLFSFTYVSAD